MKRASDLYRFGYGALVGLAFGHFRGVYERRVDVSDFSITGRKSKD